MIGALEKNYLQYVTAIETDLEAEKSHNKRSVEKIAAHLGITNQNIIKELTELAIVRAARRLATIPELITIEQRFKKIVELYKNQATLSHRTSHSMKFQQYSTPAPIAYLMGIYISTPQKENSLYFEPSAGNGLLTIALPIKRTFVNEIDEVRLANLHTQSFSNISRLDASKPFEKYPYRFDGIVSNPPFGHDDPVRYAEYTFKSLEQIMVLRGLDCMRNDGKAAVIIGGHTEWDKNGRIQAGKNLIFFNYLYNHYNVEDVINIDGHKLYSRQGTAFNVRLILINGRKYKPVGYSPLKDDQDTVVNTFDELFRRIGNLIPSINSSNRHMEINSELPAISQSQKVINDAIEHPKERERFSSVRQIDRSEITTDPKTFQGRQSSFAKETVDKIVSEGFDKSQDPIIVWFDEMARKYVVISGHSRWEASEILYNRGDTSLKMMPVKVFIGDKDDAIDYAIIESNRSGKSEGLISDVLAFKKAADKGMNKSELLRYFKPESYLSLLKDLSLLNINGRFLEYLSSSSEQSFPYLKRNAQWVGNLRRIYPQLSDSHEAEVFDYLYKKGSTGLNTSKDTLYNLIDRKVMAIDFDSSAPLNLSNMPAVNVYSDPIREQIKDVEKIIADLSRQRAQKEELIARAKAENMRDAIMRITDQVKDINTIILRKIEEKQRLEKMIGKVEREVTFDLFSIPDEPSNADAENEKKKAKLKARAKFLFLAAQF